MEISHWHLQIEALVKRAAPDLIVGLLGIPVAFAFQEVSRGIINPPQAVSIGNTVPPHLCCRLLVETIANLENATIGPQIVFRLVLSFLYLAGVYLIVSYALLDILHHPRNWGHSRGEKWARFAILSASVICLALLGVYGKHLDQTQAFICSAFTFLSVALLPDFFRSRQVIKRKVFTSYGWLVVGSLSFLWTTFLIGY